MVAFPGVGRAIFDSTDLDKGAVVRVPLLAEATIAVANAVAFIPGRFAVRTNAARVLRSE